MNQHGLLSLTRTMMTDAEVKPLINNITIGETLTRGPAFTHNMKGEATPFMKAYSNFEPMHNAMTGILRAINNFRALGNPDQKSTGPSTPEERERAAS